MITYILNNIKNYKTLILYVLKNIAEPEIRKRILDDVFEYEKEMMKQIINQEWTPELEMTIYELDTHLYEIDNLNLYPAHIE